MLLPHHQSSWTGYRTLSGSVGCGYTLKENAFAIDKLATYEFRELFDLFMMLSLERFIELKLLNI